MNQNELKTLLKQTLPPPLESDPDLLARLDQRLARVHDGTSPFKPTKPLSWPVVAGAVVVAVLAGLVISWMQSGESETPPPMEPPPAEQPASAPPDGVPLHAGEE